MSVAGASFNAGGILHEDSMEDFAKYSGMEGIADLDSTEFDGKKFDINSISETSKQAVALVTEKLGLTTDQLEMYDMDTVAGLMAIAKSMKDVEEGTADEIDKEILMQADNFFSQLYFCCLESTTSTDDDTATSGAVTKYKEWLGENKDKKDANGKDIFTAEQKNNLEDKFQQEFNSTAVPSVFDVITDDEISAGDDLETTGSTNMWHGDTVPATSGTDQDGGGDNNTGGGKPNGSEDEHDHDKH